MPSSKSLKSLVLCSIAGAAALLAGGCDKQSSGDTQPQASQAAPESNGAVAEKPAEKLDRSHKGDRLPDITLVDDTGETLDLSSLRGKPLLINLWATWCAPCIAEMPTLDTLIGQEKDLGVTVLPISQDMGQPDKVVEILRRRKLDNIQPWIDEKGDLGFQYGGNLPVTVLFDSEGKEVWRFTGGNDWTSPEALKLIGEAR
ncbi:TlpA family protein disulfide reductase [Novosphingobium mangrovi (ex Huang et al. 2023)]|uniref:TlpA family protein disulfide reductase n=1 Tax=Novosphingobium mangrovi (ex Huang et al. 2023) TaxID=2976432 RepID=A0ABT2I0H8_9SPHN|nr:TlpA disulfide reductase family protein [Novosphingobium mangrovi (ex Huang et al. 2023)]MCT2398306.1 TlpA family protein disulfide reductase [Novosphingobium mangrovi (ex Huang et al. 2023)]